LKRFQLVIDFLMRNLGLIINWYTLFSNNKITRLVVDVMEEIVPLKHIGLGHHWW
jgi:hypothetical protein